MGATVETRMSTGPTRLARMLSRSALFPEAVRQDVP